MGSLGYSVQLEDAFLINLFGPCPRPGGPVQPAHHLLHLRPDGDLGSRRHPPLLASSPGVHHRSLGSAGQAGRAGSWLGSLRKRKVDQEEINLEMLTTIEPDECYKRVICSASTGKVDNEKMRNVLKLFSEDLTIMRAPLSKQAQKFVEAARYGQVRKNVTKCEHRYQCSLPMEIIQEV